MDTAVAVIPKSQEREVREYLTRQLPNQTEPWIIEADGSPVAFVNISLANDADLDPEDLIELQRRLHSDKLIAILVDVAVRTVGINELRSFIISILEHFEGLAADDIVDHWWTIEELKAPSLVSGRLFWPHEPHK